MTGAKIWVALDNVVVDEAIGLVSGDIPLLPSL